jgi:hypothetical protein
MGIEGTMNAPAQPSIDSLSKQMDDRKNVWWAVQSSKKVPAGSTSPADQHASTAAENWVKNPTPSNQSAAGDAAKAAGHAGPGAWAAQGAAWSKPGAASTPLTSHAAAGWVKLSAVCSSGQKLPAMPKLPAVQRPSLSAPSMPKMPSLPKPSMPSSPAAPSEPAGAAPKIHQPFISLGKDVQSGKNTWM